MNDKKEIIIDVEPISRRIIIKDLKSSLYNILLKHSITLNSVCGGLGKCGKCIMATCPKGHEILCLGKWIS